MALSLVRQGIETESLIGSEDTQVLLRAEAMVSGAGREAVKILMADAYLALGAVEVQADRVVLDGTVYAQAAYRLGDEASVRALTAQTTLNQAVDMDGAMAKMIARAEGVVEHVDASYENGHMIFRIAVRLRVKVLNLSPVEVINQISGVNGLEVKFAEICSNKLSAEANAEALLREAVTLPAALDARCALMDWFSTQIEDVSRDLGGVRVTGKVLVEALIASGVAGRPVALVKYAMPFDQLVELPDWLTEDVNAAVEVKRLISQVDEGGQNDSTLKLEAELAVHVYAMGKDCATALVDAYTTSDAGIHIEQQEIELLLGINRVACHDSYKSTMLLPAGAPGVGAVLATRAIPTLSGFESLDGHTVFEGILEATALYMPAGSDKLCAATAELPFSLHCQGELPQDAWINVRVTNAEASTLMSDRLELRATLELDGESRITQKVTIAQDVTETEAPARKTGIVIVWPTADDDLWSIGKRYRIASDAIREMNGGGETEAGKAIVARL